MSDAVDFKTFCRRYSLDPSDVCSKGEYDSYLVQLDLFQSNVDASMNTKRVTVSIPESSLDELDAMSSALGLSRSATFSGLLHQMFSSSQYRVLDRVNTVSRSNAVKSKRYTSSSKAEIDTAIEALILGSDED